MRQFVVRREIKEGKRSKAESAQSMKRFQGTASTDTVLGPGPFSYVKNMDLGM